MRISMYRISWNWLHYCIQYAHIFEWNCIGLFQFPKCRARVKRVTDVSGVRWLSTRPAFARRFSSEIKRSKLHLSSFTLFLFCPWFTLIWKQSILENSASCARINILHYKCVFIHSNWVRARKYCCFVNICSTRRISQFWEIKRFFFLM